MIPLNLVFTPIYTGMPRGAVAQMILPAILPFNAIKAFANATITDQVRKHTLALELSRLDELQEAFYEQAMGGDVQSGALISKIIERRCTMLGLYTPPATTLQVVEAQAPRQSSTERINALIDRICGEHRPKPEEPDDDSEKLN